MSFEQRPGTIGETVQRWAEGSPGAPAFVAENRSPLTYGALAELIDRFGQALNESGFGRGERIGIVHSGGAAMASTLLGVSSCATAVPLVSDYTVGEFAIHLHDRNVGALIVEAGLDSPARTAAERQAIPVLEVETTSESVAGMVRLKSSPAKSADCPGPAAPEDTMFALATSGTTTHSKVVLLRHRKVMLGSKTLADHVGHREDDRGLVLQPLAYAAGLFSLCSSLYAGSSVIFLPRFDVATFFRCLETLSPTWYAGSYTFHHSIVAKASDFEDAIRRSRLRFICTTSGHLDNRVADDLEALFEAPVIETYAATEAGWISANPMPPQKRKQGTVGRPCVQEVAIMGEGGLFLPTGERGEVVVRGDMVFEGYENDPAATEMAFVNGWYRTGDQGFFDEEGYLTLTGRIAEIINRGGEKVAPAEVDAALLKHPEIREAVTFPVPHATLGEEVAAVVVPAKGATVTDQELVHFLRRRLAGIKVPRRILFVDAIPKGANEKVQRRDLHKVYDLAFTAPASMKTAPDDRPPTALEVQLQRIWAESLGLERVGLYDNFFLLGGDSLQAVELFLRVEEELGFSLPRSSLFEAGTVAEQAKSIEASTPPRCVVPIQTKGKRPPFFCVDDGKGEILGFRDLARYLGEDQPFFGLQFVELNRDQDPFTRIDCLAAHYIGEMRKVQPTGPYYLGGHSFGGRVAYVMAQQLRAAGQEVRLLALMDTYSSFRRQRVSLMTRLALQRERIVKMGAPAYAAFVIRRGRMKVYDPLRLKLVSAIWRYFEARSRPIPHILQHDEPIAVEAIRLEYRPRSYDGDAVLFTAELDPWCHPEMHDGWRRLIKGDLEVRRIPGSHYSCLKEPHVRTLAAELAQCLERRQARDGDTHSPISLDRTSPSFQKP